MSRARPATPLLAAQAGFGDRDSLGRGTTPAEVAAAVEASREVRAGREGVRFWLGEAYRDPARRSNA